MECSKLVIIGAGGHGAVVADTAVEAGFDIVGFLDDNKKPGTKILGFDVLGNTTQKVNADCFIIAIGNNVARARKFYQFIKMGYKPVSVFHPYSYISSYAKIGCGVFIAAGAVVQPRVVLGDNSIINTSSSIDHDTIVKYHVTINPQATITGEVTIERFVTVHSNSTIAPRISIGENSIVGAGSIVLEDVPPNKIVVGSPAKILKNNLPVPKEIIDLMNTYNNHCVRF